MNYLDNSGIQIARCVKKGEKLILRAMFGGEEVFNCQNFTADIGEGDILLISSSEQSDISVRSLYREGSILCSYYNELEKAGINPLFSPEEIAEVAEILKNPGTDDPILADFEQLPFVTIDNDGSKDLDQAVYVEKSGDGFIIYYAIADASYYVRPGTPLFRGGIRRGASYYLPGLSVPMLPRELSEGIVSLNEGGARRSLVFIMNIDKVGRILKSDLIRGRIRSRAKLSYSGVQAFYDSNGPGPLHKREYTESLLNLQEAGRVLFRRGESRGVINFERFENSLCITEDGMSYRFVETERSDAGRWNEQISLLCNMTGASMLSPAENGDNSHIHPVFRVHEAPEEPSLQRLEMAINSIVNIHSLDGCWIWRRGEETPAEYLSRLPRTGDEKRITETIERQILITNQRSFFSEEPGEHFALKVDLYGRFSSPMREIVGIYSHRELLEKLGLEDPEPDDVDLIIREQVINSANRSKEMQKRLDRFVNDLLLDSVFKSDLESELSVRLSRTGTVLGMKESRLYVMLDSPRLEIKVYSEDIASAVDAVPVYSKNVLEFRKSGNILRKYKAGDAISLKLNSVDKRGIWHFIPSDI